jgi:phosphoribosylaminoimidazole-succinocarboxamide synthase
MGAAALLETNIPGRAPDARGKVRDIYDLGNELLIVATDRLSAFDWVNPVGIPDKGVILTRIALHWFNVVADIVPHHLISAEVGDFPVPFSEHPEQLAGRSMLVRKCGMLPIEFVVRGYLAGSGWKEYREQGTVCGIRLPEGLRESDQLPEPIYTPATKAESGHDMNIPPDEAGRIIGEALNAEAAAAAIALYKRGSAEAAKRGLILCDTKFEFGIYDGKLMLCDEILTPDSSRYWPADEYAPGGPQPSFDKQFVRDYLETTGWDKSSPQPPLPDEIVEKTRSRYMEAFTRLTGERSL